MLKLPLLYLYKYFFNKPTRVYLEVQLLELPIEIYHFHQLSQLRNLPLGSYLVLKEGTVKNCFYNLLTGIII